MNTVVAVVLWWNGRVGLFKRSSAVSHDAGRWHCVTGYLDPWNNAADQALSELAEETGLTGADINHMRAGAVLELRDELGNAWVVHTFYAITSQRRLRLNWENEAYRWVRPERLPRFDGQVTWFSDVLRAVKEAGAPSG